MADFSNICCRRGHQIINYIDRLINGINRPINGQSTGKRLGRATCGRRAASLTDQTIHRRPKTGSNRAQNTATQIKRFLSFLMYVFLLGGLILPNWLINDSGHIAILLEYFGEFQKCEQRSTLRPLIYCRNTTLQTYKNIWTHLKNILFV